MAKDARVRLRHMNECRIFHNIHSIIFLLYTFNINLPYYLHKKSKYNIGLSTKNGCKFEITVRHLVSSYIFKTKPNGAKVKMTFRIGCDVSKQTLMLTRTRAIFQSYSLASLTKISIIILRICFLKVMDQR